MAHTSTKIYRDTEASPVEGISIYDIQSVLGSSRNDIGALITYGNINKWAKFKPYRYNSFATRASERELAHYGLSVVHDDSLGSPSNSSSFLGKLVRDQLGWEYLRPRGKGGGTGGANEWFRFLDFDGYIHDAICPVGDVVRNVPISIYGDATIAWDLEQQLDPGNITLSDIVVENTALTGYYFGVLLYQSDTKWNVLTSTTTLGTGDVQINLTNATSLAGTWSAYPFFSSVQIPIGTSTSTGVYVSAGWDTHQEITFRLVSESLAIYAYGMWNQAHTAISFTWEAYNEDSAQKMVSLTVYLRKNTDPSTPPVSESTLASANVGSITVPAKSGDTTGFISGSGTLTLPAEVDYDPDYVWWLGTTVTGISGYVAQYVQVEDESSRE